MSLFDPGLCPELTILPTVPEDECSISVGQILRMAIQFIQPTPSFTAATILTGATWTPLLAGAAETKVILTPLFNNAVIPGSEGLFTGGDSNETPNGLREYRGEGNVTFTAMFKSTNPATIDALKALSGDARIPGHTTIWGYFFGGSNRITAKATGAGFPIYNFRISTVQLDGYLEKDKYNVSFDLRGDWADGMKTFIASFDPATL